MEKIFKQMDPLFDVSEFIQQRDDLCFMTIKKEHLYSALVTAKEHLGFRHLVLITAVDWLEEGIFQITYLLNDPENKVEMGLRVFVPRDQAVMESVHTLWETAATYQRELREMFGINFPGSPRVDESFILEGWGDIPPYRRDFDTKKYSEETYFPRQGRVTHNPAEHMKKKLYPENEV
jgi:NADH-quinone oxidoreductase subunit C